MEILQAPFEYNIQVLTNTEPNVLLGIIFLVGGVIAFFGALFLSKKIEAYKAATASRKKKDALQDMILMKTIQEEMDIEMREALIREELRAKK